MTVYERLPPGRYRLNVDDYTRLADAGVFGDARTELIGGEIIVMAPEYRPHAFVRNEIAYRLRRALEELGSDIYVGSGSVLITNHDMPQPDIVMTREPRGEGATPLGSVALLVEVSSTTLRQDMSRKAKLYADAGVPEYWVANTSARVVRQMWMPTGGSYSERCETRFGEPMFSRSIADLMIATTSL